MIDSTNNTQEDQHHDGQITIMADYFSLANEIIQPDQYVSTSRYFCLKWEPSLGLVGSRIVRVLRSLGFYNRQTGEMRDGIPIDLPELAALCGFSVATIKREFGSGKDGKPANAALHTFVQREKNYKHDAVTGQVWREENIYRVKMDDPIHPDDLPRLQELWESRQKGGNEKKKNVEQNNVEKKNMERGKASSRTPSACKAQSEPYGADFHKAQNEPYNKNVRKAQCEPYEEPRRAHIDSESIQLESIPSQVAFKSSQVESNSVQHDPTLIDYSYLPKKTLNTSSDASEFSLTLFPGEEGNRLASTSAPSHSPLLSPTPLLWEHLTPEQQQSYRDQAKAELHKYAVEAGAERWARIGPRQEEVRAKNTFTRMQSVPEEGNNAPTR